MDLGRESEVDTFGGHAKQAVVQTNLGQNVAPVYSPGLGRSERMNRPLKAWTRCYCPVSWEATRLTQNHDEPGFLRAFSLPLVV